MKLKTKLFSILTVLAILFTAVQYGHAAKTVFSDGNPAIGEKGTRVTAAFLNAVNNQHHTGLDVDGHGAIPYSADTGAANAYVVTLSPALTQYVNGMPIYFKATNANSGASTVNVNSLGVKSIKKFYNVALAAGDIAAGQVVGVMYDGTNFQFISTPTKVATLNASSLVEQNPASAGQASGIATLTAGVLVVQDPANATATPTANKITKADTAGKLAAGWGGSASTLATLNTNTLVVQDPANATATPTANKITKADTNGKLAAGWGGSASTLATLNTSTLVVQDPANAQTTAAANKIPKGNATTGKLAASWGGEANSLATLDGATTVPLAQIPTTLTGKKAGGLVPDTISGAYTTKVFSSAEYWIIPSGVYIMFASEAKLRLVIYDAAMNAYSPPFTIYWTGGILISDGVHVGLVSDVGSTPSVSYRKF